MGGRRAGAPVKRSRRDPDKNISAYRIASSEKQAAKVKITERALERLDVGRQAVGGLGAAARARGGAARVVTSSSRLDDAVVDRGSFRLGPARPRDRMGRASRDPRAERQRQDDVARRAARPAAADIGIALDGTRRRRRRARPGPRAVRRRRRRCSRVRERGGLLAAARLGRCSPSSASARTHVGAARRRAVAR